MPDATVPCRLTKPTNVFAPRQLSRKRLRLAVTASGIGFALPERRGVLNNPSNKLPGFKRTLLRSHALLTTPTKTFHRPYHFPDAVVYDAPQRPAVTLSISASAAFSVIPDQVLRVVFDFVARYDLRTLPTRRHAPSSSRSANRGCLSLLR